MKKILFVFLSLILIFTLVMPPDRAKAAVVSKVAQKAVFKVVKEVAKDKAVEQSFSMVMNYKYVPKEEREAIKKPDQGFTMVCLPENRKNDICEKPIQVKNSFTTADKKAIASKVETALDSKTGNKGFLKIVNWFIPVWIVGSAYTITDLLVDGDISSFFADLGYEALVSLGFIKPLAQGVGKTDLPSFPFIPGTGEDAPNKGETIPGGSVANYLGGINTIPKFPEGISLNMPANTDYTLFHNASIYGVNSHYFAFKSTKPYMTSTGTSNVFNYPYILIEFRTQGYNLDKNYPSKKLDKIVISKSDYQSPSYNVVSRVAEISVAHENIYLNRPHARGLRQDEINHYLTLASTYWFDDLIVTKPEPLPQIKPVGVPVITPGTTTKVPSPSAVPTRDKTTGKTVKPTKTSTPGDITWTDKDGNIVPEENIIIEDLVTEETPNGTIIKNPDPSGIPEMQDGLTPNPDKAPPVDDSITEEDLEKLSCSRLKKPDFKPLSNAITTSFPFSIPWDLWRVIEATFGNMGSEKPSVDLSFIAEGVRLEIPDYFDSWTKFAKSITLIVFDIGLIYMFYRLMKGGGD